MNRSADVRPAFFRALPELSPEDRRADALCRWGRRGPATRVPVGLYAVGLAGEDSPVLLCASYRLSFDTLRVALRDCSCWMLVIDTAGLDVGSAAAAGRFATADIERAIKAARLEQLVRLRTVVVPGRAAYSVEGESLAAHTGFTAREGPMRARDIPAFLAAGCSLSAEMSEEPFRFGERLSAIPRHVSRSLQWWLIFGFAAIIYAGLGPNGVNLGRALVGCPPFLLMGLASVISGAAIAPLLPRIVPPRPFALRGVLVGFAATGALVFCAGLGRGFGAFLSVACMLFFSAASGLLSYFFATEAPRRAKIDTRMEKRFTIIFCIIAFGLAGAAFFLAKRITWSPS